MPGTVQQIFRSAGIRAFNPFHVWGPASGEPLSQADQPAAVAAEEAVLLPPGPVYDVVPAWTAMGLRPQPDTRVLYHPASGLLFASIAPEDAVRVRELCSWPLRIWGASFSDEEDLPDLSGYQPQVAVSTWLVPAQGPGGWQFQPLTPQDLMALPETARILAGRQRMIIRTGQRALQQAERHSAPSDGIFAGGVKFEAEVTGGDDGIIVDVRSLITLKRRLISTGRLVSLECLSQRVAPRGSSWLVEAGTLPDDPPLRVFHLLSLPEKPVISQPGESRFLTAARWRGNLSAAAPAPTPAESTGIPSHSSMVITDWRFHDWIQDILMEARKPAPSAQSSATPWADLWEGVPVVKIPEWFADGEVREVSAVIAAALKLSPGALGAWKWDTVYFLKGDAAALKTIRGKLHELSLPEPPAGSSMEAILLLKPSSSTASEAARVSVPEVARSAIDVHGPEETIVSRVLLPGIGGQDYEVALKDQGGVPGQDFEKGKVMGNLRLSLPKDLSTLTFPESSGRPPEPAVLTARLLLFPPITTSPLEVTALIPAPEDRAAVAEIARLPGRGTLMLSIRQHPSPASPPPVPNGETNLEMWWATACAKVPRTAVK